MSDKKNLKKINIKEIIAKGSLIAVIITIPSLTVFWLSWYFLKDLFTAAIIGGIVHFIGLGFSFKILKTFLVRKPPLN